MKIEEIGTMKELNLNVGDVVVFHKTYGDMYPHYEGVSFTARNKFSVFSDEINEGFSHIDCEHIFKVVSRAKPKGPVQTVTRKEIVPGVYGQVHIKHHLEVSMFPTKNPAELRAAAETLIEIADALEDM